MLRMFSAAFGVVLLFTAGAHAADSAALTGGEVTRFIATLDDVKALSDEMGPETDLMMQQPSADVAFQPCTDTVVGLREKYPAGYAKLETIAAAEGFSADQWGLTGDRVMRAYIVEKMEAENPGAAAKAAEGAKKMAAMDPKMLAMMPPGAKEQMDASLALMKVFEATPEGDRAAVRPYLTELDTVFDAE